MNNEVVHHHFEKTFAVFFQDVCLNRIGNWFYKKSLNAIPVNRFWIIIGRINWSQLYHTIHLTITGFVSLTLLFHLDFQFFICDYFQILCSISCKNKSVSMHNYQYLSCLVPICKNLIVTHTQSPGWRYWTVQKW